MEVMKGDRVIAGEVMEVKGSSLYFGIVFHIKGDRVKLLFSDGSKKWFARSQVAVYKKLPPRWPALFAAQQVTVHRKKLRRSRHDPVEDQVRDLHVTRDEEDKATEKIAA
nr:hypothetical protein 1 [Desulfobulbaceae bacterium]